jgi:hypothetical protein
MRAPREMRPDDAGLLALSRDDELGEKFAAFLAARVRRIKSGRNVPD